MGSHVRRPSQEVDYDNDGLIEVDEVRAYIRDKVGGEEFDTASEVRCVLRLGRRCVAASSRSLFIAPAQARLERFLFVC
jgi:hypothetical protein